MGRRVVLRALEGMAGGSILLRFPDGRGRRFGDGDGPEVTVDLHRPERVWERLAARPRHAVGHGQDILPPTARRQPKHPQDADS